MEYEKMLKKIKEFFKKNLLPQKNLDNNINKYNIELIRQINDQTEQSSEIYECDHDRKLIIINLITIENIARSEEEQKQLINYALLCGFIQIASTSYDKKETPTLCGFGSIKNIETLEYEGLTKAYIELLASRLLNRGLEENSNYIAIILVQQFEMIVGKETMLQAFFNEDKEILIRKISSLNLASQSKGLLEFITHAQKKNVTFEDIQCIQNYLKDLYSVVITEKEKEFVKKIDALQQKINESTQQASEKGSQEKGFITSIEEAYRIKQKLEELKRDSERTISDMANRFINLTIEKSTYDKYNGNQQK